MAEPTEEIFQFDFCGSKPSFVRVPEMAAQKILITRDVLDIDAAVSCRCCVAAKQSHGTVNSLAENYEGPIIAEGFDKLTRQLEAGSDCRQT